MKFLIKNSILAFSAISMMLFLFVYVSSRTNSNLNIEDERFITKVVNLDSAKLSFFWADDSNNIFRSIGRLKQFVEQQQMKLTFAMNGGMYLPNYTPQGLFVQNYNLISPLVNDTGSGNFFLKPNGVFYIDNKNKAHICQTEDFKLDSTIKDATQSGPMLICNSIIHQKFTKGSSNVHIRNAVGILPDHRVLFAMSKKEINFYDFANYFLSLGCENALYLDGFVSRTYLPEKNWLQTDGDFGVIIGIVEKP